MRMEMKHQMKIPISAQIRNYFILYIFTYIILIVFKENIFCLIFSFILEISADKPIEFKWKLIQDEFKNLNPDLNVVYLRFKDSNGQIGLYKKSNEEIKFVPEFEIEGVRFTITKCEGDNLINFWKEHGSHFELFNIYN